MAKVAGSLWVEGNDVHYVDQFNREWYLPGIFVGNQVANPGSMWIEGDYLLHYINEAGNQEYRTPAFLTSTPPANALAGSVWVDIDNRLHWIAPVNPAFPNRNVSGHHDVPAIATHTDTHLDAPHSDSPHNDGAHTDLPAGFNHLDTHNDSPHSDFNDSAHGDHSDVGSPFNDFNDHADYPGAVRVPVSGPGGLEYMWHSDYSNASGSYHVDQYLYDWTYTHADQNAHTDTPHGDSPHVDSHNDSPHQDRAAQGSHEDHSDNTPHLDVPHDDRAHGDGHSDTHADSHGDVVHDDLPILIGP